MGGFLAVVISIGLSLSLYLELDSANRYAKSLLANLVTLESNNKRAEGELFELRAGLEATTGELETTKGELDSLKSESGTASETTARELDSLRLDFQSASQELSETRAERDSLRDETNRLVQELKVATDQNQTLALNLGYARETQATANVQTDNIKSALASFKTAYENYYAAQLAYDQDHYGDCEFNPSLNIRNCAPWAGVKSQEKENLDRLWETYKEAIHGLLDAG